MNEETLPYEEDDEVLPYEEEEPALEKKPAEPTRTTPDQIVDTRTEESANQVDKTAKDYGQFSEAIDPEDTIPKSLKESVWEGLNKSSIGQIVSLFEENPEEAEKIMQSVGFWNKVVDMGGEMAGDLIPMFIGSIGLGAAGAVTGGGTGMIIGGPPLAAMGAVGLGWAAAAFGAMATPQFIKDAIAEYKAFQLTGGDKTFGEFLMSEGGAERIAKGSISSGLFGILIGGVSKAARMLKDVPALKPLFEAKWVGKPTEYATRKGIEVGAVTGMEAAAKGELPTPEDFAKTAVLFTGMDTLKAPGLMKKRFNQYKNRALNVALANKVQGLNLSFPPVQELEGRGSPNYKTNKYLDENIREFDYSFAHNLAERISQIEGEPFETAHDAGLKFRQILAEGAQLLPEETPNAKPEYRATPLVNNPILTAINMLPGRVYRNKGEAGTQIKREFNKQHDAQMDAFRPEFEAMENQTQGINVEVFDQPGTVVDMINNLLHSVEEPRVPNKDQSVLIRTLTRLQRLFTQFDEDGNPHLPNQPSLREVIASNRSLKDIPEWEAPPNAKDRILQVTEGIDQLIRQTLEEHDPNLAQAYVNLNSRYSTFKRQFVNPHTRSLFKTHENYNSIGNQFRGIDALNALEDAIGSTPEGAEIVNSMRKTTLNSRMGNKVRNAQTNEEFTREVSKWNPEYIEEMMQYVPENQRERFGQGLNAANRVRRGVTEARENYDRDLRNWRENKTRDSARRASDSRDAYNRTLEAARDPANQNRALLVDIKQDLLTAALDHRNITKLPAYMQTVEGIRAMREATGQMKGGRELFNSLAQLETRRMFDFVVDGYIDKNRFPYDALRKRMYSEKGEFRAKLREMNGPEFVKAVDELVSVADHLSKGFKEYEPGAVKDSTVMEDMSKVIRFFGITSAFPNTAVAVTMKVAQEAPYIYSMWNNKSMYTQQGIQKRVDIARSIKMNRNSIHNAVEKIEGLEDFVNLKARK